MSARHPHDDFPTARMNGDDLAQLRLLGRPSFAQLPPAEDVVELDLDTSDHAEDTIPIEVIPECTPPDGMFVGDLPRVRFIAPSFRPPSFGTSVHRRGRAPWFIGAACVLAALAGVAIYLVA